MIGQDGRVRKKILPGQMQTTTHNSIITALQQWKEWRTKPEQLDEVLQKDGLHHKVIEGGGMAENENIEHWGMERAQQDKVTAVLQHVADEMLRTHGEEPGGKREGVIRLIYENVNGLSKGVTGNKKIKKV